MAKAAEMRYSQGMLKLEIDVRPMVKRMQAKLTRLQKEQLPFATALALTRTAQKVQGAEKDQLKTTFPTVTPFTQRGVALQKATKGDLTAVVFLKDIQSVYLAPYEKGGKSIPAGPGKVAMLTPKAIGVNQYGNIPYKRIAKLKANTAKYFIGDVTTKSGTISGLWERTNAKVASAVHYSTRKKAFKKSGVIKQRGLRLLMRFTDPRQVKQHLGWYDLAKKVVAQNFPLEFKKALRAAFASAK